MILNFIECGNLCASDDGRLIVTYKANESGFTSYQAKYNHNFEVLVKEQNLENAQCVCLQNGDILIGNEGVIYFLDGANYQ